MVTTLVAYASKYGGTHGIAERIGQRLRDEGQTVDVTPVKAVRELGGYDAFVIGSAVYMGHWLKEATDFVKRHSATLAAQPVWLFSSGPLGIAGTDSEDRDLRVSSVPNELSELAATIHPRDHRVFFGAMEISTLRGTHRLMAKLPAARKLFVEGDFRDFQEVDSWAQRIARELAPLAVSRP
jgi:menaquinone-dependent protoporphyrinogen oxidase